MGSSRFSATCGTSGIDDTTKNIVSLVSSLAMVMFVVSHCQPVISHCARASRQRRRSRSGKRDRE